MGYRNHKLLESGRTVINMGRGIKAVRAAGRFFWQLWKKIYHRWYDRGGERNHPLELRHKKHPGLWDYLGDPKRDQRSSKYAVRRQKRWRGAGSVGCSAGSGVICAGSAGERAWAIRIKLSTKKAEAVWNRSFKLTGAGKE